MTENLPCAYCGGRVASELFEGKPSCGCIKAVDQDPEMPPVTMAGRVVRAIRHAPGATVSEICEALGIEWAPRDVDPDAYRQFDQVHHLVGRLTKRGVLDAVGGRPRGYFVVGEFKEKVPVGAGKTSKAKRALAAYNRNRRKGKCTQCWAKLPAGHQFVNCDGCRAKKKRKESRPGHCAICDGFMEPEWRRYRSCPTCRERKAENMTAWRSKKENRERVNAAERERSREKRARLAAEKRCNDCHRITGGPFRCDDCREAHRVYQNERRALTKRAA